MKTAFVCFNGIERNGEYTFLKHLNTAMAFDTIVFANDKNVDYPELDSVIYVDDIFEFQAIMNKYDSIIINNGFLKFEKANYDFIQNFKGKLGYVCHGTFNDKYYGFDNLSQYLDFAFVFSDVQAQRYTKDSKVPKVIPILLPYNEQQFAKKVKRPNTKIVSVVTRMSTFKMVNEVIDLWLTKKIPYELRLYKGPSGRAWNNQIVASTQLSIKDTLELSKPHNIRVFDEYKNIEDVYNVSDVVIDNSFIEDDNNRVQYTTLEAFGHRVPILVNKDWSKALNDTLAIEPMTEQNIRRFVEDEKEVEKYQIVMHNLLFIHKASFTAERINKTIYGELYNEA